MHRMGQRMEVMQMAECRCRARQGGQGRSAARPVSSWEDLEKMPMNRYINPNTVFVRPQGSCRDGEAERALLEQLVEQSVRQNQSLVDLLGAVNALTAALLAKL